MTMQSTHWPERAQTRTHRGKRGSQFSGGQFSSSRRRAGRALVAGVVALTVLGGCSSGAATEVQAAHLTRADPPPATGGAPETEATGQSDSSKAPQGSTPTTTGQPSNEMLVTDATVDVHMVEPHVGVYRDGKIVLQGDVPSRKVADSIIAKAAAVVGDANVIDRYRIDPAAPAISDGRVIIAEPLLFPTASATLSAVAEELIPLGVAVMKLNPQVTMRVTGYTDNMGDERMNVVLSTARALAVVDRMVPLGIDRSRFIVVGKGESDPVAGNDTSEGRQLNRRIEIDLINLLK